MATGPIAVDARMPAYTGAGITRYVQGLLGGLAELRVPDVTALLARKDTDSWWHPLRAQGIRIERARTPCHHRIERWMLPLEVAKLRPRLFHAADHVGPSLRLCPAVVTVHDLAFWRYPATHSPASRRYYAGAARTLPHADAVICVSASVRADLLRALPLRPERVHVVHNGLDARFTPQPDPAAIRARFGLPQPYVLAVGTIEERKNLTLLLAAVALLGRTDLHMALAGAEGWGAQAVRETAARLGLTERVHWLGRVDDADLVPLYSSAAALAFPSRYEGFAFPPLEAMACGTPVVAVNSSSLPEVCGSGADAAADLVPPDPAAFAAALARVLDDAAHRATLIERGAKRARRFTWRRCAEETLAVYRSVLHCP